MTGRGRRPREPLRASSVCWFVASGMMVVGVILDLAADHLLLSFLRRVAPGSIGNPAPYRSAGIGAALVGASWAVVLTAIVILAVALRRGRRAVRLPLDAVGTLIVLAAILHLAIGLQWMPGRSLMSCAQWAWTLGYCGCIVAAMVLQHSDRAQPDRLQPDQEPFERL